MHKDVEAWSPSVAAYDHVTVHFLRLPSKRREKVFHSLGEAVAPGGTLLIVGHHPPDLNGVKRPSGEGLLFTPESLTELVASSDRELVACEARPRDTKTSDGRLTTVHDSLFRARQQAERRSSGRPDDTPQDNAPRAYRGPRLNSNICSGVRTPPLSAAASKAGR